MTIDELKAKMAAGRPNFVTALATQSARQTADAQTLADEKTISDYLANHPDPTIQAFVDATPDYGPRARLRADGNVDVDAPKQDGTSTSVVTMGKTNRRHLLAEVMRNGGNRTNRESVYRSVYLAMPKTVGTDLPDPSTIPSMTDGQLDGALQQLGRAVTDVVSAMSPSVPSVTTWEMCSEVSIQMGGQQETYAHAPNGLYAQMSWPHKKDTTCVRDQGNRNTSAAFATTSALEMDRAIDTGEHWNLSEQDLYAFYKRGIGEWDSDGAWPDQMSLWLGLSSYSAPTEASWLYNPSFQMTPIQGSPFHGACLGYAYGCSETSHQTPISCITLHQYVFCTWDVPNLMRQIPLPNDPMRPHERVLWNLSNRDNAVDLAEGLLTFGDRPVIITLTLGAAFFAVGSDGYVNNIIAGDFGAHAVHAVGFVPNSKLPNTVAPGAGGGYFIVKNSWGRSRGDQGYVYLPVAWLKNYVLDVVAL